MNGTRRFSSKAFPAECSSHERCADAGGLGSVQRVFSQGGLPAPDTWGIEHVVVLMMQNRSFDHMLGWLDGAHAQPARRTSTLTRSECCPPPRITPRTGLTSA